MAQELQERQQFTPEGQELPEWLSYQAVTTTIDGIPVTTGTVLRVPLTYYGPSIPLGPDWTYGGETSPAPTPTSETESTPSTSGTSTSSVSSIASVTTISADNSATSQTASDLISRSSPVTTSSYAPSPVSDLPSSAPSALSLSFTTSTCMKSSSTSARTCDPTAVPSISPPASYTPDTSSDLRTTLTVLLPSIIGPLLLALLVLLLCFCLFRRRSDDYTRAAEDDSSERIVPAVGQRQTSSQHKIPPTPPRMGKTAALGPVAEKAPLLAQNRSTQARIPSEKPSRPVSEPEEEDITDLANPGSSSLLSRLSLGLGLAPTMRRISNGTAEKAYRTPSWALAGLAALPRRISSGFRSGPPSIPTIQTITPAEKLTTPADASRTTSHMQSSGNGNDSSAEPPSAGYARTMGDDELFYQQPQARTASSRTGEGERGSQSSRGSSTHSASSRSRSTRGTGPSNWQRHFPALEEDGPPLYNHNDAPIGTFGQNHVRRETVSVGVPETPKTGIDSVRSSLLLAGERRSRWVEEGDRMDFPVPPGGMLREGGQRDSIISVASGNSNYYSANSHPASGPDTPPPYSHPTQATTVRLVQTTSDSADIAGDTLRPIRRAFARALSNERGSSEDHRGSYVGEPLLAPGAGLAEFGQLRSVSGGRADTLLSGPNNSNARSSHYASVHISDSSPSMYSRNGTDHSGSTLSTRPGGEGEENLADSGMTFGAVRDQALRGRRSQATLVSATSIRRDQGRTRTRSGPAIPPRSAARPPPLPRLASEPERPLPDIPDERGKRKKSWFPFGK